MSSMLPERARSERSRFLAGACTLALVALAFGGCVSKSKADKQARNAFMAGQQQAMMRTQMAQTQGQGPCVTVNGEVRNHVLPWTEGMTLAQAIVAAEYFGAKEPGQVIVVRNGVAFRYDTKQLLSGTDVPLQLGDILQLIQQPAQSTR